MRSKTCWWKWEFKEVITITNTIWIIDKNKIAASAYKQYPFTKSTHIETMCPKNRLLQRTWTILIYVYQHNQVYSRLRGQCINIWNHQVLSHQCHNIAWIKRCKVSKIHSSQSLRSHHPKVSQKKGKKPTLHKPHENHTLIVKPITPCTPNRLNGRPGEPIFYNKGNLCNSQ